MADDSTFGGGLSADVVSGAAAPDFGGGAARPASADVTPPASAPSQFGSGLAMKPAPTQDPLDIAASNLEQRVQRAESATTGVKGAILGLLNPEARMHNLALIPAATEQLTKIRQTQATIAANQAQAANLGLRPGDVSDYATQEQRVEVAKQRALKGDLKVFQGLQVVDPKTAEAIAPQVHEVMAGHLNNAQFAYDKLSNMQTQGEYTAALKELRNNGTLSAIEQLGFKVPDTLQAFNASKALEGKALRDARIDLNTLRTQLEERNTYQPMEKKEAETYTGRLTTAYGDDIKGTWSRNAASGTRGLVINGAADPRDLGKSFTLGSEDQRKALREEFAAAVPKEQFEKYREFNRTYKLATTDGAGKPVKDGEINSNPNVQQGIAEGLASMLRGGSGGANVGLLKIELAKRGWVQNQIDNFVSNWGSVWNTIEGKDINPQLSKLTQGQVRDVLDALKSYNDTAMNDRAGRIAERAGALGFNPSVFGFSKDEAAGGVGDAMNSGRDAQIQRMLPHHQAIGGGDGVLQLGAQAPGAGAASMPPGTQNNNQLPGARPVATPVQQAAGAVTPPQGTPPAAPGPSPAATQPTAQGPAGGPPSPSGGPGPSAPASPPGGGAGGSPAGPSPRDPVSHALEGVSGAVQQWLQDTGAQPATVQKQVDKVLTNPRIAKELEDTGTVSGKTVAAALGKGGDKSLIRRFTDFLNAHFMQGVPEGERTQAAADVGNAAVEHAPAIGGTIGGAAGFAAGGPAGSIAGGGAGSAAGQAVKDYIQGREQSPRELIKQAALGAALGVVSEARPVLAAAGRVVGAGVVEGGAAAAEGKTAKEAVEAGAQGAGLAAGGEAFGRALGMVGHKLWNMFSPSAKTELASAAKTLTEARQTLETTEPKIAGPGGTGSVDNPAYVQAEQAVQKAETTIKDAGLNPEEVAYAYKVAGDKVPTNEATVGRPGAKEAADIGAGYQQQRDQIAVAGVGTPKASPKLDDGPIAAVENGSVVKSQKNRDLAEHVEMQITAPAKSWADKWQQLSDVRSELLTAERDALASTATGKSREAKDMRTLADTVRAQQVKVAEYVFGKTEGQAFIKRLEVLDRRYARLMDATNGGDVVAAAKWTGEKGREAEKAFMAFAHDDPAAQAAYKAMRAKGSDVEKDVRSLVAAEKIPGLGALIGTAKLAIGFKEWMAARAAGKPVDFATFLGLNTNAGARPTRDMLGNMGARGAVQ